MGRKEVRMIRRSTLSLVLFVASVGIPTPSGALLASSSFEGDDGNLVVNGAAGAEDWANTGIDCEGADANGCGIDIIDRRIDDAFGKGAKDDTLVPTVVRGSIPPNKSDLSRFYVADERATCPQDADGCDYLMLAWERTNILGTANFSFEFNQSTSSNANPGGPPFTPVRTTGDLLIVFDWDSGANKVSLGLLRWLTTGSAAACEANSALPCWGNRVNLTSTISAGAVNLGAISEPIAGTTLPEKTFGEAIINLTGAGVFGDQCLSFGAAFVKGRSSTSFTAELKDMIAPIPVSVDNCKPAVITLRKVDPAGLTLSGATMQLFKDSGSDGTAGSLDATDTQIAPDVPTGASADCVTTGDGIGNCVFTLGEEGLYIGHELTPPNGYHAAADQTTTVTISDEIQHLVLTFTDSPVPGAIRVHKADDAGNALAGATFSLYQDVGTVAGAFDAGDVSTGRTCTTDTSGDCPAFTEVALGAYCVVETTTPAGYATADPQCVSIGLGSAPETGATVELTFVDPRLHRVIVVVCHQGTNDLDSSSVTLDGVTKTSLARGATLPDALDEAELCGLGGASFGDRPHGTDTADITIAEP